MAVTINQVLQEFDQLSLEDKEYVKETVDKLLIEEKREELFRRSEEAMESYKAGKSKTGSAADLLKDLND
jgi:hypothetical protein